VLADLTIAHNTPCLSKNVPPLACYNFDTWMDFDIFCRNATDKVSNQKTLYYATWNRPNMCFCTTWKNGKHENCVFHSLYWCIARIQQVTAWFLQSFWLTTHNHAAVWLSKSCNQCVQLGAVGAWFRRKEVESVAVVGLCCTHKAPMRCLMGFLLPKVMLKQ